VHRQEFETMNVKQVLMRARNEGPVQRGKPLYFNRPWTQLLNEMEDAEVKTVGALTSRRISELHSSVDNRSAR
jgi:hypothetical protein